MPSLDAIHDAILEAASVNAGATLIDLRVGHYWSVVQASTGAGMASTLRSETHLDGAPPIPGAGSLLESSPIELAVGLHSPSPPEASLGLATANALLGPPDGRLTEHNAEAILADRGAGKRVAIIGHFPFSERLAPSCADLWVFERGEGRRDGDLGAEMMEELLPQADVVGVTSTTIINGTLPEILDLVRPDAYVLLLGPSTPLTPRLFDFGIDLLCGTIIVNPESVLRAVEQGAVTSQITGVRRVCLWPA
jgi:uncharacterized protein (DUF4213/DUF364 family)